MGPATQRLDREFDYEFEGTWQGAFYNQAADDSATSPADESVILPPGSVAGTFGVTNQGPNIDASDLESYVGAFGAHKQ